MELTQQLDDFRLRRRVVSQSGGAQVPDVLNRAPAVHQADEREGGGGKPVEPLVRAVLQNIPDLPAILMAVQRRMAAQARREGRNPVPGWTEKCFTHGVSGCEFQVSSVQNDLYLKPQTRRSNTSLRDTVHASYTCHGSQDQTANRIQSTT